MQPRRIALGTALVGLGMLAYGLPIARFDPGVGLASTVVAGLGFFLATAGFLRGTGGAALVAAGLVLVAAEALFGLRDLQGEATVLMPLVWAAGTVQAAWFAARWAAKPEDQARCLTGVRLGLAFAGLSFLGWMLNDLGFTNVLWWPGNLLGLAGAVVAVRGLAPPAPPRARSAPDPGPAA